MIDPTIIILLNIVNLILNSINHFNLFFNLFIKDH